jgi:hypothetical protein
MVAPKKNEFWKLRSKHGREKIFASPALLWSAAMEFMEALHGSPLKSYDYKSSMKTIRKVTIPLMRAPTWQRFGLFCEVDSSFFKNFKLRLKKEVETLNAKKKLSKKDKEKLALNEDFIAILTRIQDLFFAEKFEGAAAGILKESIISRDLHLQDTAKVDHKSSDGSMTPKPTIVVIDKEAKDEFDKMVEDNK